MTCPGESVRLDDTSVWVASRGPDDGFPLVLLHGGPGLDHHEFGDYLDPLATRGYRLLLMDLRGHGLSEAALPSTWTLERMAQDVIMLALASKLGRYAVLGHSYGAFIALQNAVDFPGMASVTILSCGVPSIRWLDGVGEALEKFEPTELRESARSSWEREAKVQTPEDVANLMHDQWPFHFANPRDLRISEYEERTAGMVFSPEPLRHMAEAETGGIELQDRLSEVPQPALVLAGRHDRVCSVEASELMAREVQDAELHVFEESAHMPFVEQPEEYVQVVGDFLDRVSR